jgi:hypothetical protein
MEDIKEFWKKTDPHEKKEKFKLAFKKPNTCK